MYIIIRLSVHRYMNVHVYIWVIYSNTHFVFAVIDGFTIHLSKAHPMERCMTVRVHTTHECGLDTPLLVGVLAQ